MTWTKHVDEPHTFSLKRGEWWCDNEEVISEECEDYTRCENGCYCNLPQR